eukprot:1804421-Rhodomonas_salina.2
MSAQCVLGAHSVRAWSVQCVCVERTVCAGNARRGLGGDVGCAGAPTRGCASSTTASALPRGVLSPLSSFSSSSLSSP